MEVRRNTRLCLVRHGETAWNAERRLQGHLDVPLNEIGHVQAEATAASLAGHRFAAFYCSDLRRAQQTAAAAGRTLGFGATLEPELRERHYGVFQGLTYDEARERFPQDFARFHARDPDFAFCGDGESLGAFAARIHRALDRIAARHAGRQTLVVTHGGVLDIAHRLATGKALDAPRDFTIPNAALNWIEFDGCRWHLLAWADQAHLAAARDELPNT
ncbi:histidine phosphatase family protein [Aromatoleum bremense]|uniref:Histidine phosphatase family protein n=1 Tax=Aromatoleum bremense TaxID=76115 RepID=A0ABX1NS13_9RHOO|nr:histidine phosphatase family protein [Aromatoleum bremense]NMG14775.1 histidine phosphatase family protein [Aromatoleum bremense]QTQ30952.1 Putative phosphoglycerate mutase [Aromatoleum bremense]